MKGKIKKLEFVSSEISLYNITSNKTISDFIPHIAPLSFSLLKFWSVVNELLVHLERNKNIAVCEHFFL